MPLEKLSVVGLEDANQRRRLPETINKILDHQFDDSRRQTDAEKLASITPVNYAYPPGHVKRYGAKVDGVTDDWLALTAAIAQCIQDDGAPVYIPAGVLAVGSAVVLQSFTTIYGEGRDQSVIYATASSFSILTDNNSPVTDISITDLRFEAVSVGGSNRAIFFDADTSDITERVKVERCDFANLFRGLNAHRIAGLVFDDCEGFDLGSSLVYVGVDQSNGRSSRVRISNIRTNGGDTAADAVGTGNIFLGYTDNCTIYACEFVNTGAYSGALTTHHHAIYVRSCTDLSIDNVTSTGHRRGAGLQVYADVAGLGEQRNSRISVTNMRVSGTTHYAGVRLDQINGLTMANVQVENCYSQAFYITNCNGVTASNLRGRNNNQQAASGTDNAMVWLGTCSDASFANVSGTDDETTSGNFGQGALFVIKGTCADIRWTACAFTFPGGGASGYYGIHVPTGETLTRFSVNGFTQNGASAFFREDGAASQGAFARVDLLNLSGSTTPFSTIQLHKYRVSDIWVSGVLWPFVSDGTYIRQKNSNVPTIGTYAQGDIVERTTPAAGFTPGWVCTTSGTFSTATDNTGDTDGSTAVITGMADTSGFLVGEYVTVSAGFATTGPFKIVAKTASSITVDTSSNSAQSNVTVATPDPIFKAMGALAA